MKEIERRVRATAKEMIRSHIRSLINIKKKKKKLFSISPAVI